MPNPEPASARPARSYDYSLPALAPKTLPAPIRFDLLTVTSLLSVALFLIAGMLLLPLLGLEADEVMYLYDLWHPEQALSTIHIGGHVLPSMMMSYLGAVKSWLYIPIFGLLGSSVWAIRAPMLLLAAVTILLTGRLARRIQGKTAAAVAVALLGSDTVFLVTAVFDWGPVVIQNFLLVAGLLCGLKWFETRRHLFAFLSGLAYGLALWNKAIFLWTLSGILIALLVVATPLLFRIWSSKAAALLTVGLCAGSYPLLSFNFQTGGSTLKSNAQFEISNIGSKAVYFAKAIDGEGAPGALVDLANSNSDRSHRPLTGAASWLAGRLGATPSSWRFPVGLLLIAFGLAVAKSTQRRWILFFLISGFVGWLQAAVTPQAGSSIHHTVLFWIGWYAAVALAAGCIVEWRPRFSGRVIALATVLLAVAGLLNIAVTYGDLLRHSPLPQWSNADSGLATRLSALGATEAITVDWGIADVIAVRSRDRLAVQEEVFNLNNGAFDREQFEACRAPQCWMVTHIPGKEIMAKASQTLQTSLQAASFVRGAENVINDSHETPTFLVFAASTSVAQPPSGGAPIPKPEVSATPTLIATPSAIAGGAATGRITITWRVPADMTVEVHIGSPGGQLFASSKGPGQSPTGFWVKNGMQFFLLDVTNGKTRTAGNTVAQLVMGGSSH